MFLFFLLLLIYSVLSYVYEPVTNGSLLSSLRNQPGNMVAVFVISLIVPCPSRIIPFQSNALSRNGQSGAIVAPLVVKGFSTDKAQGPRNRNV